VSAARRLAGSSLTPGLDLLETQLALSALMLLPTAERARGNRLLVELRGRHGVDLRSAVIG
jgi:hypothetical protein